MCSRLDAAKTLCPRGYQSYRALRPYEKVNIDEPECLSVCLSVRPSIASLISETSDATAINVDTVAESVMKIVPHVLIIFALDLR